MKHRSIHRYVNNFFGSARSNSVAPNVPKVRGLRLEALEERRLLSATPFDDDAARVSAGSALVSVPIVEDAVPALVGAPLESDSAPIIATGTTLTVSKTSDSDMVGTLRYAINNAADGDVVTFASSLAGATISLSSELTIRKSITIDASSLYRDNAPGITISGANKTRVFRCYGANVQFKGIAIADGSVNSHGAGVLATDGDISFVDCSITNCKIAGTERYTGGGVFLLNGTGAFANCSFSGNAASASSGGAVHFSTNGSGTFANCSFTGNSAESGGAIHLYDKTATFYRCLFTGNSASSSGGAAYVQDAAATLSFDNCLLVSNTANFGGAVFAGGNATLTNCTVANNSASTGAGAYVQGSIAFYNSIVALNGSIASNNLKVATTGSALGFHTLSPFTAWASSSSNNYAYDANLPLFENVPNGDCALASGSQALNKGSDDYVSSGSVDLAGNPRIFGSAVDLGAYEGRPNACDLAKLQAIGMNETDDGVVWNDEGRLVELTVSDPTIATIDLSGCDALKKFACEGASGFEKGALSSLNLSGCCALEEVRCSYNNLTNLNLSGCANLRILHCGFNNLTGVDLSSCAGLSDLRCVFNDISELDVSGLSNLQILSCNSNSLSKLDLSGLSKLTSLYCCNNNLSELDLSGCSRLSSLDCRGSGLRFVDASETSSSLVAYFDRGLETIVTRKNTSAILCVTKTQIVGAQLVETDDWDSVQFLDADGTALDQGTSDIFATCDISATVNGPVTVKYFKNGAVVGTSILARYFAPDVAALQILGLSPTSSGVVWNDEGRLVKLTVSDPTIATIDLSGCDALEELTCINGNLTSLNLTGCASLKTLSCGNNSLTSLNLTDCANLKTLRCDNNSLTGLDVSDCASLQTLSCDFNNLTSLDVSGCANLRSLDCGGCDNLASVDISGCANLRSLGCCQNNNLTSLDVSGCASLQTLNCFEGNLTSLNASGCSNLQNLYCFENNLTNLDLTGCANLRILSCFDNELTSLDVSDCANLATLYVRATRISALDLTNNSNLQSLTFDAALKVLALPRESSLQLRAHQNDEWNALEVVDGNGESISVRVTDYDASFTLPTTAADPITLSYFKDGALVATTLINPLTVETPVISGITATKSAISFKINPVANATRYVVDCATDSTFANCVRRNYSTHGTKTLSGLDFGTSYYFRVKAIAEGFVDSEWTTFRLATRNETLSEIPTLTLVETRFDSIAVSIGEVAIAERYVVEYDTDDAFSAPSQVVFDAAGAATVYNLASNATYYFRVKAIAERYDDSPWSDLLTVSTLDPATVPLDAPTLALSGTMTAIVAKIGAVDGASKYVVEYATDASFSSADFKTYSSAGIKTISRLPTGTWYYVRVKATATGRPDSAYTEVRKIYTGGNYATPSFTFSAVKTSVVLNIKPGKIDANQGAPEKYVIEYSESPDFSNAKSKTFNQVVNDDGTLKPCKPTISGLTFGTSYYFRVKAIGSVGNDSAWNNNSGKPIAAGQLAVPTFFTSKIGTDFINVRCYNSAGASGYEVMFSTSSDFANPQYAQCSASSGTVAVTGLSPNTKYYYKVRALGDNVSRVNSTWSVIVNNATTKAAPTSSAVLDEDSPFENYFEDDELDAFWDVLAKSVAK